MHIKLLTPPGDAREDWIIFKDLANKMKKPLEFNNLKHFREKIIKKDIQLKKIMKIKKTNKIEFCEEEYFNKKN